MDKENAASPEPSSLVFHAFGSTHYNSDKNLKCPKCNWHYKYKETLEAHIREKHGQDIDFGSLLTTAGPTGPAGQSGSSQLGAPGQLGLGLGSSTAGAALSGVLQNLSSAKEQCTYCKNGLPHPKKGRHELPYLCGYKPFHCAACNYSSSSKGNLTIHMQSDKHINNVRNQNAAKVQADMGLGRGEIWAIKI